MTANKTGADSASALRLGVAPETAIQPSGNTVPLSTPAWLGLDPAAPEPGRALMLVVAHPDDETLALGGTMPDLAGLAILHVTDGSPRDELDARAYGFADHVAYAAARRRELEGAVALAGVAPDQLLSFGIADQDASNHLATVARRLVAVLRERPVVTTLVTHAYEGGHPDHDAVAFAVHAAAALLRHEGRVLRVAEVPLYHEGHHGFTAQRFADPRPHDSVATLDGDALQRRRAMLACHASQAGTLAQFGAATEAIRWAAPDFSALPNRGRLYYDRFGWKMDGAGWMARVAAARRELDL